MFEKLRLIMELVRRFATIDDITNAAQFREMLSIIVDTAEVLGVPANVTAMIERALENENFFKIAHAIVLFLYGRVPQPALQACCCPDPNAPLASLNDGLSLSYEGEDITVDAQTAIAWVTVISQLIALWQWFKEQRSPMLFGATIREFE